MDRGYGHLKDRKSIRFQYRLDLRVFANEAGAIKATRTETFRHERVGHGRGCFLAFDGLTTDNSECR